MIHDLLLRWIVTALFVLGAIECGLPILVRRRPWTVVVNHSVHFLMAVAMAVMAWPWGAQLPTTGPAMFFLLAAIWFTTIGIIAGESFTSRLLYGYHALMMLATAWMYATMNGPLRPAHSNSPLSTPMPGMDMGAMNEPASSGAPTWFTIVNWLGVIIFAAAAAFWAFRCLVERRHATTRFRPLGNLAQAMIAAGMAILFIAMLFEI
jgi:hypothetical protein